MNQPFEVQPAAFWILAVMVTLSALAVVRARILFHAGIALVTCFIGVAGLYVTLQAHFVAGIQVLVYAGAIAVLLLFAIMLTHRMMDPERDRQFIQAWPAMVVALLLLGLLWAALSQTSWTPRPDLSNFGLRSAEEALPEHRTAESIPDLAVLGRRLIGPMMLPFELVSVLILVAMVGALVIARKEGPPPPAAAPEEPRA